MFPNYIAMISNYNGSVPYNLSMVNIPFKNWTYNHHVIFQCKALQKFCLFPINRFSKFTPSLLSCAEGKWHHPCFLQWNYIKTFMIFTQLCEINWQMIIHMQPTCKHNTLTPEEPAASIIGFSFSKIAFFWSAKWAVVGRTIEFWIKPTLTIRGSLNSSLSAQKEKAWNQPDSNSLYQPET